MVELSPGASVSGLLQQLPGVRQTIANGATGINVAEAQRSFLNGIENLEAHLGHSLSSHDWSEQLYSTGYWAIRDITTTTPRPMPLLRSESDRVLRWLDEIITELKRISDQDEWDNKSVPRIVLDTSAIVREGEFDTFDWEPIVNSRSVRLILPILVIGELDNLKNSGKEPKARKRLRRIYELLEGKGRGPAEVRAGVTIELLMNPPRHKPLAINDEEIIRRALYLNGRVGGSLKLISGDYRMVFTGRAEGLDVGLTPAELRQPTDPAIPHQESESPP